MTVRTYEELEFFIHLKNENIIVYGYDHFYSCNILCTACFHRDRCYKLFSYDRLQFTSEIDEQAKKYFPEEYI